MGYGHDWGWDDMTPKDIGDEIESLQRCCMSHTPQFTGPMISAVIAAFSWYDWDSASFAVVQLKDGSVGVFREDSDSTGHG
jgi:hypothetical protein